MSASRIFGAIIRHPRIVLAVALLLAALSIFYTSRKLEFLTGRDDLMPRHAAFQKDYQAYRAAFGDQEEIAVVIEGADPALVSRFSDALYARLSQEKRLLLEVLYPGGMPYFRQNGLLFMSLDELKAMANTLEKAGPVLQDLAAAPSIQTLFSSLTNQIDDYLKAPTPDKLQRLTFMLGTLDKGFAGFDGKKSALSMDSFLTGGADGKPSALENAGRQQVLAIRPLKETDSFVPAEKAIKKVREELNILRQKPEFKGVTAGVTGVPVLEYEEMATSMKDMERATLLTLILTVVLLLVAFRGWRNVVAAMVSLLVAVSCSFGFATLVVGHLNILSMAFAVMLIGLGIEYGIQVVLRYQEELRTGMQQIEAIERGVTSNFRAVVLAAATVALAFATFAFTDFKGIAELGIIASGGIVMCVAATFTVLPAMLVLISRTCNAVSPAAATAPSPVISRLFQQPKLLVFVTVVLSLICLLPATRVGFDFNLMNLQAKGLESVRYAYKLMKSKENSGYFGVAMANNKAEAEQLTKRFEALPSVDHVVSLSSLIPDQQPEKLAELQRIKQIMADVKPVAYEENLKVMELPAVFEGFRDRVEKLKNNLEAQKVPEAKPIATFLATLDKFFAGLEKEKDGNALTMLREMQESMFAPLPEKLNLLKESLNARTVTEADVPLALKERFVGKDGRLLLQIAPKKEIFDEAPLAEFVNQIKSVYPHATGEPVSVYESFRILKQSYLAAFFYAFIGITLILLVAFRSLKFTLLGIMPLISGLLLMVGGMWLFGLRFNVANVIVLPLVLGVGVDSAIYLIARYRREGETPLQVVSSSAGVGVFLNALTILFSFGALMVARHQGVFSIGAVMSLGMTAIVLAFLIFLPALLLLLDRRNN
ncbi:MAG: MMPL family transporter [Geobacteraceae bacterium]|nr:MMPL family transporter [Geobacteraceae bacterium]